MFGLECERNTTLNQFKKGRVVRSYTHGKNSTKRWRLIVILGMEHADGDEPQGQAKYFADKKLHTLLWKREKRV